MNIFKKIEKNSDLFWQKEQLLVTTFEKWHGNEDLMFNDQYNVARLVNCWVRGIVRFVRMPNMHVIILYSGCDIRSSNQFLTTRALHFAQLRLRPLNCTLRPNVIVTLAW